MLASDSGEMDSALFLLSRGVTLGLEKRDTADGRVRQVSRFTCTVKASQLPPAGWLQCSSQSTLLNTHESMHIL